MTHPYGERVHQLILSELLEGKDVITYRKCVGGLHFLLWKQNVNSGESTNDSNTGNISFISNYLPLYHTFNRIQQPHGKLRRKICSTY